MSANNKNIDNKNIDKAVLGYEYGDITEELKQMFKVIISEIKSLKDEKEKKTKRLLSFREAMKILGVGKTKLYNMVSLQEIPSVRIDGSIKFDSGDIEKFIKEKKKEKFNFQINVGQLKGSNYIKK
ncbi:MAG: helix-turn-helix domain-containing protein [bacterium]